MRSDRHWPVAIIGAGFSGTMAAAQLARRGIASVLIEGGDKAGLGVAYSTTEPAHLLNVPAGNMSAWPDVPDDFARRTGDKAAFAERRDFGAYLRSILDEVVMNGCVTTVEASALGARLDAGRWSVELGGQPPVTADALVLATGNQPPGRLKVLEGAGERLISNPWSSSARAAIEECAASGAPVLIVGTGLTMVDVVLSLQSVGHDGHIVAVSRRGLIPRGHAAFDPVPVEDVGAIPTRLGPLFRWLRDRADRYGWRAAIDSLRPHSHVIWQSLSPKEQRRFLRHARPWWDAHRHRIAPQVAKLLADLIAAGRLDVVAGRIRACRASERAVEVEISPRSQEAPKRGQFAFVFNCTGPLHSIASTDDPLLSSLLDQRQAQPDELGIGLAVDEHSRVAASERLWAIGPLTKGRFWEIIAVPDIRNQAAAVADAIARELDA